MKKNKIAILAFGLLAIGVQAETKESVAISTAQFRIVNAKTDVLGRHNPNSKGTPTTFAVNVDRPIAAATNTSASPRMPVHYGQFEYRKFGTNTTFSKKYILDGDIIDETTYKTRIDKIESADYYRNTYTQDLKREYTPPTIPQEKRADAIETFFDECYKKSECSKTENVAEGLSETITYQDLVSIMKNSGLNTWAISPGYRGRNIGIYVDDAFEPLHLIEKNFPADIDAKLQPKSQFLYGHLNGHIISRAYHTTNVQRIINKTAENATLYSYISSNTEHPRPVDPFNENPKAFIGCHTHGSGQDSYNNFTREIDNYVYNTRVVEFVSAANEGTKENGQSNDLSMGLNVITVGAVHNKDNSYHQTSSWKNPHFSIFNSDKETYSQVGNSYVKPEIANFSDFIISNTPSIIVTKNKGQKNENALTVNPTFKQTSSATPYTAGIAADLMERFPFYKWHPEVVKALMITASTIPIKDASTHDSDNKQNSGKNAGAYATGVIKPIDIFKNNRSRYWYGQNSDFFNSNNEIKITEDDIKDKQNYRIAISWLSSGDAATKYGRLPQDIDLIVKQNGNTIAESVSTNNPFELVSFKTTSSKPLEIIIKRYGNYGNERVILGYNMLEVNN